METPLFPALYFLSVSSDLRLAPPPPPPLCGSSRLPIGQAPLLGMRGSTDLRLAPPPPPPGCGSSSSSWLWLLPPPRRPGAAAGYAGEYRPQTGSPSSPSARRHCWVCRGAPTSDWLLLLLSVAPLPPPLCGSSRLPVGQAPLPGARGERQGAPGLPRASAAAAADRLGGAVSALSLAWGAFLTANLWGSPTTLPHKGQSLLSRQLHVQTPPLCGGAGSVGLLGASFATLGRCFRRSGLAREKRAFLL